MKIHISLFMESFYNILLFMESFYNISLFQRVSFHSFTLRESEKKL